MSVMEKTSVSTESWRNSFNKERENACMCHLVKDENTALAANDTGDNSGLNCTTY